MIWAKVTDRIKNGKKKHTCFHISSHFDGFTFWSILLSSSQTSDRCSTFPKSIFDEYIDFPSPLCDAL